MDTLSHWIIFSLSVFYHVSLEPRVQMADFFDITLSLEMFNAHDSVRTATQFDVFYMFVCLPSIKRNWEMKYWYFYKRMSIVLFMYLFINV